jgi:glyoxylase-like metal-dependent hydrolase (beta-lactamase superfamily II)
MIKTSNYEKITRFDLARTIAGRGRYWTTCYLVDGLLIDSGCYFTAAELLGALSSTPPHILINSHSHEDHIGGNSLLQRVNPELNILAHPLALPVLADPRGKQPQQPYRRFYWGIPKPSQGLALADGQVIATDKHRFEIIYTPGHSRDHICLYEPSRGWLFSGDLFNSGRDRALREGYEIWGIIDSLKRIASLPIETLYPGCARVRQKPKSHLLSKIEYLEDLGERVLEMHRRGVSVRVIVRRLLGKPMWVEIVTLGHFSRRRLVLSYLKQSQHQGNQ